MTELPFKHLSSWNFKMFGKEDVAKLAETLSLIKSLCSFSLEFNFDSEYLLTPDDFFLFRNLPVTSVDISALDLKRDNIKNFDEIMKQMKIRDMYSLEEHCSVKKFGPGDIYRTIKKN